MAAFRLFPRHTVFFNDAGALLAGGTIQFFETGTDTPKDVFGEKALSTNNGSVVDIGLDGRADVDVWGEGSYRIRTFDEDDAPVTDEDPVEIPGSSLDSLPEPSEGFLFCDGVDLSYVSIREVPDPTGHSGEYLGNDGDALMWLAFGEDEEFDFDNLPGGIEVGADYIQIGNKLILFGNDTAATNSTNNVTASVAFNKTFDTAPKVFLDPTIAAINDSGWTVSPSRPVSTTTGFTANFWADGEHGSTSTTIDEPVTFDWVAIGTRTVSS